MVLRDAEAARERHHGRAQASREGGDLMTRVIVAAVAIGILLGTALARFVRFQKGTGPL